MKKWIFFLLVFGMFLTSSSACRIPKTKDQMEHKEGEGHDHNGDHKDGDGHGHKEGDGHEHKEGDDHKH